jgi:hypothetical protein
MPLYCHHGATYRNVRRRAAEVWWLGCRYVSTTASLRNVRRRESHSCERKMVACIEKGWYTAGIAAARVQDLTHSKTGVAHCETDVAHHETNNVDVAHCETDVAHSQSAHQPRCHRLGGQVQRSVTHRRFPRQMRRRRTIALFGICNHLETAMCKQHRNGGCGRLAVWVAALQPRVKPFSRLGCNVATKGKTIQVAMLPRAWPCELQRCNQGYGRLVATLQPRV